MPSHSMMPNSLGPSPRRSGVEGPGNRTVGFAPPWANCPTRSPRANGLGGKALATRRTNRSDAGVGWIAVR